MAGEAGEGRWGCAEEGKGVGFQGTNQGSGLTPDPAGDFDKWLPLRLCLWRGGKAVSHQSFVGNLRRLESGRGVPEP